MTTQTPPTDVQATLSRLSAYKNVQGVLILSRTGGGIIQSSGSVFDGDKGKKYGKVVAGMVEGVGKAVGDLEEGDDLKFLRIRTKRHELIISPDDKYLLVVLQDPA